MRPLEVNYASLLPLQYQISHLCVFLSLNIVHHMCVIGLNYQQFVNIWVSVILFSRSNKRKSVSNREITTLYHAKFSLCYEPKLCFSCGLISLETLSLRPVIEYQS